MKCQIQWIDGSGKATADGNEAVGMAHFHAFRTGVFNTSAQVTCQYLPTIDKSYPICAEHMAMVEDEWRFENGGGWEFGPLNSSAPSTKETS